MLDPLATVETVQWRAYPSWRQFAWLYLMRLLVCAAALRRWATYRITTGRVTVTNGYTGHSLCAVLRRPRRHRTGASGQAVAGRGSQVMETGMTAARGARPAAGASS